MTWAGRSPCSAGHHPGRAGPAAPPGAAPTRVAPEPSVAGPQACADASATATANGGYTASQLAGYYLMSPLYARADLGQGVRVALAEIGPNLPSDIATYEQCYGIKTPVSYLKVDGGAGSGSGAPAPEAALDIEDVAGLAPDIAIDVYQSPNSDAGVYDMFKDIVDADQDKVVSASFGECERSSPTDDPSYLSAVSTLMGQAAAQGQTVFASSGDTGSSGCYDADGQRHARMTTSRPVRPMSSRSAARRSCRAAARPSGTSRRTRPAPAAAVTPSPGACRPTSTSRPSPA